MKFTLTLALGSACICTVFATSVAEFGANVAKGLRLIETEKDTAPFWVTESEKLDLIMQHEHFLDLTETYPVEQEHKARKPRAVDEREPYPNLSKSSQVKSIISTLNTSRMSSLLSNLTAFNNRYFNSSTGKEASTWIHDQLVSMAKGTSGVSVSKFTHPWAQFSVIAKFNGTSPTAPAVIIGAHEDSINRPLRPEPGAPTIDPVTARAPGADDNGTGVVNLMEVFRALVAAKFAPSRPVEFHFYAAEEVGLQGSQEIATSYRTAGKGVHAMVNFDMTGYFRPGSEPVIALAQDFVDEDLSDFLRFVIKDYCSIPTEAYTCGKSCGDHTTWTRAKHPSAHPFEALESNSNKLLHTSNDTVSVQGFNWTHSLEFAKIAVAVAVELGSV